MERVEEGIILNFFPYDENDAICKVFFSNGEIYRLFCKGVQKEISKNRLNLKEYSLIEFEFFANEVKYSGRLKRATLIKDFSSKESNFVKRFNLIRNSITSHKKLNSNLFNIFVNILNISSIYDSNYLWILLFYKEIFKLENININVNSCTKCGSTKNISSFSLKDNGILCKNCITRYDLELSKSFLLKIISLIVKSENWIVLNLNFTHDEKRFLNSIFSNFLIDNLGINAFLLESI